MLMSHTSFAVHLAHAPQPDALAHLCGALHPAVNLTVGPDLPDSPSYTVLVAGRPAREWLTASPHLHTLLIPFAGLPAVTRATLRDFPHLAVYNLHHNAAPTAEMALALLLAAAKQVIPSDRTFRRHDWTPRYAPYPSLLLHGKTALILGYGAVGARVGDACRALGMTVLGTRRSLAAADNGLYPADVLPDLLPRAQVMIICLPGTDETTGLIGERELALLPPGAILVNVGRAAVVDQHALYAALASGRLGGAGLDVWYTYPPDVEARSHTPPAEVPFHELDHVVMSPHRAGGGGNADIEQMRMAALAAALNQLAAGEALPHRVDLEAGY